MMRAFGRPVIFDATHTVQMPGAAGTASGGATLQRIHEVANTPVE